MFQIDERRMLAFLAVCDKLNELLKESPPNIPAIREYLQTFSKAYQDIKNQASGSI